MSFDLAASLRKLNFITTTQSEVQRLPSPPEDEEYFEEPFPINGAACKPNHTVQYMYPDLSLLPEYENLHLPAPASAAFREGPVIDHIAVDMSNTSFFTVSPVKEDAEAPITSSSANSAEYGSIECRMARGLIADMERLPYAEGQTTISLVTFTHQEEVRFRIKRSTVFIDGKGWDLLGQPLGFVGGDRAWLKTLDCLYLRANDLACLHVREQLAIQGHAESADAEAKAVRWAKKAHWSAVNILLRHLAYRYEAEDGSKRSIALRKQHLSDLPEKVQLKLPCRHRQHVDLTKLTAFDQDECMAFHCETCGASVMTERDAVDLEVLGDQKVRDALRNERDFEDLDDTPTSDNSKTVNAECITAAVELARSSFTVPSSIIPMAQVPEFFEETTMVSAAIEAELKGRHHLPASPKKLHSKLREMAEQLLLKSAREHGYTGSAADLPTPLRWLPFAEKWFTRAVNFLFSRECDESPHDHRGAHWHGNKTFHKSTFERPFDEAEDCSDEEDEDGEIVDDDELDEEGNRVLQDESEMEVDRWCG